MTKLIVFLVNLVVIFHLSIGALPIIPPFTKCALTDSECVKASCKQVAPLFFRGAPELNITRFAPLKLELMDLCTPDLSLVISDVTVSGLQTSQIISLESTSDGGMLGKLVCDLKIEGKYKMDGLFMSLPVNSEGNLKLVLNQLLLSGRVKLEEVIQADKKPHWRFGEHQHHVDLLGIPEVEFESVFDGIPRIESPLCDLVSKNSKMVAQEMIDMIMKFVYQIMIDNVNKFFEYLPVEDLIVQ